jgi:hypothetical protein
MNRQQAKWIIEDTFKNSFDEDRFRLFIRNLCNEIDDDKTRLLSLPIVEMREAQGWWNNNG